MRSRQKAKFFACCEFRTTAWQGLRLRLCVSVSWSEVSLLKLKSKRKSVNTKTQGCSQHPKYKAPCGYGSHGLEQPWYCQNMPKQITKKGSNSRWAIASAMSCWGLFWLSTPLWDLWVGLAAPRLLIVDLKCTVGFQDCESHTQIVPQQNSDFCSFNIVQPPVHYKYTAV